MNAGVWVLAKSRLEAIVASVRQSQLAEIARSAAVADQTRQDLLTKYDRNHNGIIDLNEREDALDDTNFIQLELDQIDTNHNGWLEPAELAYFDANTNRILEPKEQAGVDIAQRLLAQRLFAQFDWDNKGWLNWWEIDDLLKASFRRSSDGNYAQFSMRFYQANQGHYSRLELEDLLNLLHRYTVESIRAGSQSAPFFVAQPPGSQFRTVDAAQRFKEELETYWRYPNGRHANGRPGQFPFPSGTNGLHFLTNRVPQRPLP
jgi:Ca2+-binding EF-hand superfamily protein